MSGLVGYVAYGSNLVEDYLLDYVDGRRRHRDVPGCRDRAPPAVSRPCRLEHDLLFGAFSPRWGGSVAFCTHERSAAASAYGRAWLVTVEQFADIAAQECGQPPGSFALDPSAVGRGEVHVLGPYRYGGVLGLGHDNGVPMVTLTSPAPVPAGRRGSPGPVYRAVIAAGLKETWALDDDTIEAVLRAATVGPWSSPSC